DLMRPNADIPAIDAASAAGMAHQRQGDGCLARAGFPDQGKNFSRRDVETDTPDDLDLAARIGNGADPEITDGNKRGFSHQSLLSRIFVGRLSMNILTEMVSEAMAIDGKITAGAPRLSPSIFSRTNAPQSALGGCTPRPRKDSPDRTS